MKITKALLFSSSSIPHGYLKSSLQSSYGLDFRACGHALQHCTDQRLLLQGKQIHGRLVIFSVNPDNFLGSKLINFYSKTCSFGEAYKVFDEIPHKNIFSWNAMLMACTFHKQDYETIKLFSSLFTFSPTINPDNYTMSSVIKALSSLGTNINPKSGREAQGFVLRHGFDSDIFVENALIACYVRMGHVNYARKMFDGMTYRDIVSWNSMITGYAHNGLYDECKKLYQEMMESCHVKPDNVTFVGVLQACVHLRDLEFGMGIHQLIIQKQFEIEASLCNSLIGFYAKCGSLDYARELFNEMNIKDEFSYGTMISGYMFHGYVNEAIDIFENMDNPRLSTWNSVISGLVQNNHHSDAMRLIGKMRIANIKPNSVTLSGILPALSFFSNLRGVKEIHGYAIRNSDDHNIYVATALIDSYAKSGFLQGSYQVFAKNRNTNVIVWTSIISAHAAYGHAESAFSLFDDMIAHGVSPDHVTFTSLLTASSHAGLVEKAWHVFKTMMSDHGIEPMVEHYACMVGVLSRAGLMKEAMDFVLKMPIKPNAKVLGALLNGASIFGDLEVGKFACDGLFEIEPECTGNYIILANLYSKFGKWEEAENVRMKMHRKELTKIPGCSWIETGGNLQIFSYGDSSHQQREEIYGILWNLIGIMSEEGYDSLVKSDEDVDYISMMHRKR